MDEGYNTLESDKLREGFDKNNNTETHTKENSSTNDSERKNSIDLPPESDLTSISSNPPTTNNDDEDLDELRKKFQEIGQTRDDDGGKFSGVTSISSNSSSSSDDEKKKQIKRKSRKLKELLTETKNKLGNAQEKIQELEKSIREEHDAKERVETSLSKLQEKHREQLKDEESLRSTLAHKDQYCINLEKKTTLLQQQITRLRKKSFKSNSSEKETSDAAIDAPDNTGNSAENVKETHDASVDTVENMDEAAIDANIEMQAKLMSNNVLIETYLVQIKNLDQENTELKSKVDMLDEENKDLKSQMETSTKEKSDDSSTSSFASDEERRQEVQERIQVMERNLDELQVKIENLENENESLQTQLAKEQQKFKETLHSNQETSDSLTENFKNEITSLQDRLRKAEENNNESLLKSLRQEILDAQLTNERLKQSNRDALETKLKELAEKDDIIQKLDEEKKKGEEKALSIEENMKSIQKLAHERRQSVSALQTDVVALSDTIKLLKESNTEKDEEISDLTIKLDNSADMLSKLHEENKLLKEVEFQRKRVQSKDVDVKIQKAERLAKLKEEYEELSEEHTNTKQKLKMKSLKVKYLKKQMRELIEQKQKAESIMFVLPEMQKKNDNLEAENEMLKEEIASLKRQEEERLEKLEQERRDEEERERREKETWERVLLGIGRCELYHENGEECFHPQHDDYPEDPLFNRPNSAPPMKPRPPSARRYNDIMNSGQRKLFTKRAPTLNPSFLDSYPEGRKATERMREHQSRIVLSKKNKKKLFRSATEPSGRLMNSFNHSSGNKHFPKIPKHHHPTGPNGSPRVLVWGESQEGPGQKLVAVGDYVLARIKRDCTLHGESSNEYTGYIKFIGFIEGNTEDVYIGMRLDDEGVGNTDGRVEGRRYFRCEARKGKFIRLNDIVKVLESKVINVTLNRNVYVLSSGINDGYELGPQTWK